MKRKLAIVCTHPIQYYAPVFKLLSDREKVTVKVFYTWPQAVNGFVDSGFKKVINWDIPLLEGYDYELVPNSSKKPGSKQFGGIKNPDLIDRIQHFKPDAILIFGWNFHSHLALMRHFKGKIPLWFRGDSTLLDEKKGVKQLVRRLLLRWVYRHIDKAFFVGCENKRYFQAHGLTEDQMVYAPHAIDNRRFSSIGEHGLAFIRNFKKQNQIPENDCILLFAGKFETKKDPLLLLRVFDKLKRANCHLCFVGNGVLEEQLKEGASGSKNIYFIPFQNQVLMPAIYHMAKLVILPSRGPGETWGLAINEAMACGRAVLVSDKVGCGADLVRNGQNGFIFKSGDFADLTKKLVLLIDNDLEEMGRNSALIIQSFNFEAICVAIEKELVKLA